VYCERGPLWVSGRPSRRAARRLKSEDGARGGADELGLGDDAPWGDVLHVRPARSGWRQLAPRGVRSALIAASSAAGGGDAAGSAERARSQPVRWLGGEQRVEYLVHVKSGGDVTRAPGRPGEPHARAAGWLMLSLDHEPRSQRLAAERERCAAAADSSASGTGTSDSELADDAASDDSCSLFREPDVRIRIGPITIARGGI